MTDLLEALMIICFGLSWPISIRKSWTARTAKGKSLFFEVFICIGYVFGIVRKFLLVAQAGGEPMGFLFYLAWFFYFVNLFSIMIDMALYFRNSRLDRLAEQAV